MSMPADLNQYLLPVHVEALKKAAKFHNVAILVRRMNKASLKFFDNNLAVPKRLDCKAKTADFDVAGTRSARVNRSDAPFKEEIGFGALKQAAEHGPGDRVEIMENNSGLAVESAYLQENGHGFLEPGGVSNVAGSIYSGFLSDEIERTYRIAGLVVDPTIFGRAAFKSNERYRKALLAWENKKDGGFVTMLKNAPETYEEQEALTYVPNGGQYYIERNPKSRYFGCVKFTNSTISAGKVIHGDIDLYGIVDMTDPQSNVRVEEQRLGVKHTRSPKFADVQLTVNRLMGKPMIQHGSQDTYAEDHEDDDIDVFFPDGTVTYVGPTAHHIAVFYEQTFNGRKLFKKGGVQEQVRGSYTRPV